MMTSTITDIGFTQNGRRRQENAQPIGQFMVEDMLRTGLIVGEDWEALPYSVRAEVGHCENPRDQFAVLLRHNLLTEYQVSRIEAGNTFGLVLGNYRILDQLGFGGMGTVFRGEHSVLRRPVAIKVLHPTCTGN